jgi:hypothetical protein
MNKTSSPTFYPSSVFLQFKADIEKKLDSRSSKLANFPDISSRGKKKIKKMRQTNASYAIAILKREINV